MALASLAVVLAASVPCLTDPAHAGAGPSIEIASDAQVGENLIAADVAAATAQVRNFFRSNGLQFANGPLVEHVKVFATSEAARAYFHDKYAVPLDQIPETFAGTVQDGTLYLVAPGQYRRIWGRIYSRWPWRRTEYRRLIAHELAHVAHEAYAKAKLGSADAMGPPWFFEGFAVMAAGQFATARPASLDEIRTSLEGQKAPSSYPELGRIVRGLTGRYGVARAVDSAGQRDFPQILWRLP